MFIGVIDGIGTIEQTEPEVVVIVDSSLSTDVETGSHIAVNGVVLRVLSKESSPKGDRLKFYPSNLNQSKNYIPLQRVNLEKALRLGEEIPGTIFYGIPTVSIELISKALRTDGSLTVKASFKHDFINYLSVTDQVCVDGALLQIVDIDDRILSFRLYPSTLETTNLQNRQVGEKLNIELDLFTLKLAKVLKKVT